MLTQIMSACIFIKNEENMKKINKNSVLDILGIVWTSIFIAAFLFYPTGVIFTKSVIEPMHNAICVPGILYLILKKIFQRKSVIINSKFDILLNIFFVSMFIPIFLNTYVSLYECISYCLFYFTILVFYNVVKNLCKEPKNREILINIVLVFIFIIMIYGIDIKAYNTINNNLGLVLKHENSEHSIYSFHYIYHNELSIVMLTGVLLSQYKILKNKKNWFYRISLFSSLVGMILAMSRITMVLFAIFEIFYYFKYRKKIDNCSIEIISLLFIFGFSIIYTKIYEQFESNIVIITFIILGVLSGLIFKIIELLISKVKFRFCNIEKKKRNKLIIFGAILLIIFLILSFIPSKIIICKDNIDEISGYNYKLGNIQFNQKNDIEINYEYNNLTNKSGKCQIVFNGVNENGKYEKIANVVLENYTYQADCSIYIGNYNQVKYNIVPAGENKNIELKINYIKVNGKKQLIKNNFIPLDIQYFIDTIDLKNVSVNERLNIYKDAIKIIIESRFMGLGANAWKCIFESMQSINYYSTEIHSRCIEIMLSYGIFGFICYILLVICYLKNIKKIINEKYILILGLIAMIFMQSLIDFVMSEFAVITIFYFLLALLVVDSNEKIQSGEKVVDILINCIYALFGIYLSLQFCFNAQNDNFKINIFNFYDKYYRMESKNNIFKTNNLNDKKLFFENELRKEKYGKNYIYLEQYIKIAQENDLEIDKELIKNTVLNMKCSNIFNVEDICEYINSLASIYKMINNYKELNDIIILKIRKQIEDIELKLKNYSYWPIEFNNYYLNKYLINEALNSINKTKEHLKDEGIMW